MANRRMFAMTIIDSDMFLDLPVSTQNLYFHLCMRADDDGFINNPRKIQRMIGASEDDLKLLIAKQFIIPFDSGIVVIKHWRIHNYIQKDRYHSTMFMDEKAQLGEKKDGSYALLSELDTPCLQEESAMDTKCVQDVSISDTECIHDVSKMDTEVRLGKVRLGKDSLDKANNQDISDEISSGDDAPNEPREAIPYTEIQEMYNRICKSFPRCVKMSSNRKKLISGRWNGDGYRLSDFERLFTKAEESKFLRTGSSGWRADIEWLIRPSNMTKVLEGKYDDRNRPNGRPENVSKPPDGAGEEDPPWIIQG